MTTKARKRLKPSSRKKKFGSSNIIDFQKMSEEERVAFMRQVLKNVDWEAYHRKVNKDSAAEIEGYRRARARFNREFGSGWRTPLR